MLKEDILFISTIEWFNCFVVLWHNVIFRHVTNSLFDIQVCGSIFFICVAVYLFNMTEMPAPT